MFSVDLFCVKKHSVVCPSRALYCKLEHCYFVYSLGALLDHCILVDFVIDRVIAISKRGSLLFPKDRSIQVIKERGQSLQVPTIYFLSTVIVSKP